MEGIGDDFGTGWMVRVGESGGEVQVDLWAWMGRVAGAGSKRTKVPGAETISG